MNQNFPKDKATFDDDDDDSSTILYSFIVNFESDNFIDSILDMIGVIYSCFVSCSQSHHDTYYLLA